MVHGFNKKWDKLAGLAQLVMAIYNLDLFAFSLARFMASATSGGM